MISYLYGYILIYLSINLFNHFIYLSNLFFLHVRRADWRIRIFIYLLWYRINTSKKIYRSLYSGSQGWWWWGGVSITCSLVYGSRYTNKNPKNFMYFGERYDQNASHLPFVLLRSSILQHFFFFFLLHRPSWSCDSIHIVRYCPSFINPSYGHEPSFQPKER